MKRFVLVLFIALFINGSAQQQLSNPAKICLQGETDLLFSDNNVLHALAMVSRAAKDSIFIANGITVNGKFGNIWSLQLPLQKLCNLESIQCIQYLELATRANAARFKNDIERQFTSVDKVQNGLQNSLPMNYSGKGVVVGIVDIGFQGNNPTFFNANGSATRIVRWWQQSNKNGTPPSGFSYGTELTDSTSIINANDDDGVHGTHVAGIAAGSGHTTPGLKYRGMAPEADLVFVSIKYANDTLGGSALGDYVVANSTILDAYQYIFNYAQSVGKPAVINLSWGMHTGPHDGTSLFDKATENLVGKGKILVGSNGNEGDNPMHWNHTFTGDTAGTMAIESDRQKRSKESVYADFWGSAGTDFSMQVLVLDTNMNLIVQTPFVSSTSDKVNLFHMFADTSEFKINLTCDKSNALNNKPNITLMAEQFNPKKYVFVLKITSANAVVHGWNSGAVRNWTSGSFRNKVGKVDLSPTFIGGNTDYTCGENGGTSKAMISVGAMAARSAFSNWTGKLMNDSSYVLPGFIAKFSSKGPTVDGRIKPDVAAPGFDVPSSMNNKQFEGWMLDRTILKTVFRNDTNFWTTLNGTSMASPHVCGIVALMLQAYPGLTAQEVRIVLQQTATRNTFTGNTPNNQYGHGIVNAYEAVKMALYYAGLDPVHTEGSPFVYPNPAGNVLNIKLNNDGNTGSYRVLSAIGQVVFTGDIPTVQKDAAIDITRLESGLYCLELSYSGQLYQFKFLKN